MINPGDFIQKTRKKHKLSQREFAKQVNMSFRQIQRIEKNESNITLKKFNVILSSFDLILKIFHREPDWNVLFNFGMPINIKDTKVVKYKYEIIEKEIILASHFLLENMMNVEYLRHFDAFKGLLLSLKIHYPSKFNQILNLSNIDLNEEFNLSNVLGRHIKLRNISLTAISNYFRDQKA